MLGNMYMYRYWVNILANINVYWGCVSRSIHVYWGCVLGADVQYICPTHIRCHPIHQYIPNTCRYCPTHIVVVQYMWTSVLQDTNVPQHMWKYVCWITSIYIGSHAMCIGYISWITFVLPNTHEKMLSNVHGELPNTYTQCAHRVPNIYLGWILTLTHMCIVQHHMCTVSQVSIGVQCIGQHHKHHTCIGYVYLGAPHVWWVTLCTCIGEHCLKTCTLNNNMYWVHSPNTCGGVAHVYWKLTQPAFTSIYNTSKLVKGQCTITSPGCIFVDCLSLLGILLQCGSAPTRPLT